MHIEEMRLQDFLQPFPCSCWKQHTITSLKRVEISDGALDKLPALLKELRHTRAFVIADATTYEVAGRTVLDLLKQSSFPCCSFVFPQPEVTPDEKALGSVLMDFDTSCDVIIGVGSGTINDISRFLSFKAGKPYMIVGTAPSMDGFASNVAPLIRNNLKTTFETHVAEAIVADLDILSKAPAAMIAAGFGDILGKYTCLADWRLSHLINGEYLCQNVWDIMNLALKRTMESRDGLLNRDKAAIQKLTEALILAGIAMSYAGNSRPASGCEHHMSHFWEMRFLFAGKRAVLHGTKVGIATVAALKLHEYIRQEAVDVSSARTLPTPPMDASWEHKIKDAFQDAAPEVIALEKKARKNSPEERARRLASMEKNWPEIQEILASLPESSFAEEVLKTAGGPTRPQDVGLDRDTFVQGVLYAKEVRNRYTLLQLLWDLGLLNGYAKRLADELFN